MRVLNKKIKTSNPKNIDSEIQRLIDYKFKNYDLLRFAFCHKSSSIDNYERLELLGDSVLRLVITDYLYNQYENASEGDLSREIQNIVNKDQLAEIAFKMDLLKYLDYKNIRIEDINLKSSISADILESLIGAIYLDGGYLVAKSFVLKIFYEELIIKKKIGTKDAKTLLQEYCQEKKISLPKYETERLRSPDHNPMFIVTCSIKNPDIKIQSECKKVADGHKTASSQILKKLRENEKN